MVYSAALSADGSKLVIGAPNNDEAANAAGQVQVFELLGNNWVQLGQNINGLAERDRFGWSVSISDDGSRFSAGAIFSDPNGQSSGQASVFEFSGAAWSQLGNLIDGEVAAEGLGRSVSLSGDGNLLAIGVPFNDAGGTNAGRSSVYSYFSIVPVEWATFRGEIQNEQILLHWSTASEVNNWKFAIQRSTDGKTWEEVGAVLGQGTTYEHTTYEFTDKTPRLGANYYRLKQIDWDGSSSYSTILLFDLGDRTAPIFRIYPNPASEVLYFEIPGAGKACLYNTYGQLVREVEVPDEGGIDISTLPAGVYWLTAFTAGQQISQRIVKE
ncbi:MAG: T9SS type A sorting domain-containing protein [Bacteroidota bacterium]